MKWYKSVGNLCQALSIPKTALKVDFSLKMFAQLKAEIHFVYYFLYFYLSLEKYYLDI